MEPQATRSRKGTKKISKEQECSTSAMAKCSTHSDTPKWFEHGGTAGKGANQYRYPA
jgi:hypothetical protein